MSLAQYASPYNNDDSGETDNINANIRMTQSQGQNKGGGGGKKIPASSSSSSFRKTIKRPLMQQQQQQQQQQKQNVDSSQSRVSNFMSKLSSVKGMNTNYLQGGDGTNGNGNDESESDLADYQPLNSNESVNGSGNQNSGDGGYDETRDDGVVTRESFENLPSTYASQYYQQYVPLSYNQQILKSLSEQNDYSKSYSNTSRDDLVEKMNHIIQMLEDQQDEKTGSVTEELILYCFLGVFVIFVVDSFVRAGKYVR